MSRGGSEKGILITENKEKGKQEETREMVGCFGGKEQLVRPGRPGPSVAWRGGWAAHAEPLAVVLPLAAAPCL